MHRTGLPSGQGLRFANCKSISGRGTQKCGLTRCIVLFAVRHRLPSHIPARALALCRVQLSPPSSSAHPPVRSTPDPLVSLEVLPLPVQVARGFSKDFHHVCRRAAVPLAPWSLHLSKRSSESSPSPRFRAPPKRSHQSGRMTALFASRGGTPLLRQAPRRSGQARLREHPALRFRAVLFSPRSARPILDATRASL
jgi:hypothetical protein